jgi:nucleoid-associated protein YgaU
MSLLGPTGTGTAGTFSKLTISFETTQRGVFDGELTALFNPNHLRYDNRAEWRAAATVAQSLAGGYQRMEFQATPPATLALDLFFDTYEGAPSGGAGGLLGSLRDALIPDNPFADPTPTATDVKELTSQVVALTHVQSELHRPPVCRLRWGRSELFRGVLTELHQDFTFFMPDGTPVRATLGCTFMAYRTFQQAVTEVELHSADVVKRHVVRRGDTLASIAVAEYNDPSRWRAIAAANNIDDPRKLAVGAQLVVPKLTP